MGKVFKQKQLDNSVVRVEDEANKSQFISTPTPNTSTPTIDTTPAIAQPSVNELKGTQNVGFDEVSIDFNVSSQDTETDDKLKELLKKK